MVAEVEVKEAAQGLLTALAGDKQQGCSSGGLWQRQGSHCSLVGYTV